MRLIPKPTSTAGAVLEVLIVVLLSVGFALALQAFVVKPYQIPSGSMKPTLVVGQRVLANRISHELGDSPEIGDIVVFHPPLGAAPAEQGPGEAIPECGTRRKSGQACPQPSAEQAETNFIKRVVAGPGDRLYIEDGRPVVNGEPAEEDFTLPCGGLPDCNLPKEITIPAEHYFMMGDNRGASDDSRRWGPVPEDWIIGEAVFTYWPLDRLGLL